MRLVLVPHTASCWVQSLPQEAKLVHGRHVNCRCAPNDQTDETNSAQSLHRFSWQKKQRQRFRWCGTCGGDGFLPCFKCGGRGLVATKPGNAGVAFHIGTARCSDCSGMKKKPCPLCAGMTSSVRAPLEDPYEGLSPEETVEAILKDHRPTIDLKPRRGRRRSKGGGGGPAEPDGPS